MHRWYFRLFKKKFNIKDSTETEILMPKEGFFFDFIIQEICEKKIIEFELYIIQAMEN